MAKYVLSIDNGTTGSFCIMDIKTKEVVAFVSVPTFKIDKWTKAKKDKKTGHFTVVDVQQLKYALLNLPIEINGENIKCYIERPAVGFSGWGIWTSLSGMAAWVAVQYALREFKIPYETVDSKEWQSHLIPQAMGVNNKAYMKKLKAGERNKLLKEASDKLAKKLYPKGIYPKSGDGDSVNMAYYYCLKENNEL